MPPARPTFLYDADCGPCSRFKRLASFFDPSRSVDFVPIAAAARLGLLDSVPPDQWYSSSRMITPDGRVSDGGDAFVALLGRLPWGRLPSRALSSLPFAPRLVRRLYGVASTLHGTSCGAPVPDSRFANLSAAWSLQ